MIKSPGSIGSGSPSTIGRRAVAFDDEADRSHGVAVRRGELAGPNHLRAHEQSVRRAELKFRMLIADEATKRFFRPDEFGGIVERRANLVPLPQKRSEIGLRLAKAGAGIGNRPVTDRDFAL